jgi:hypothetical protein
MSQIISKKISTTSKNDKNYKSLINILIKIIGDTIEQLVKYKQKIKNLEENYKNKISLNIKEIPNITITNYLKRLIRHSNPEPSTLILGVIYFDRICNNGNIIFNFFNVYKLLLISFVLAIKFNEEYFETNQYYSKIGGLNLNNFNKLEIKVLEIINYDLYVYEDLYVNYLNQFSALIEKYLCKL